MSRAATVWNLYGAGLDRLGHDGRPEAAAVPEPGPGELLVRPDAVGLCFSDTKIVRLGPDHPKLQGRDLTTHPVRLGHEVCLTVVAVGAGLEDRHHVGQRLALQPDIYRDGVSTAYGYTLEGGLGTLQLLGPDVLDNEGLTYVFEAPEGLSAAAVALTEPWACVISAYTQRRRLAPLAGGRAWVHVTDADVDLAGFDVLGGAAEVLVTGAAVPEVLRAAVARWGLGAAGASVDVAAAPLDGASYDDIVLVGALAAADVAAALRRLHARGLCVLLRDDDLADPVAVDVGRLHYDYIAVVGTASGDLRDALGEERNRCELRAGGVCVVVGAAGPMGQMHVQYALEHAAGPRTIVATDVDRARLDFLLRRFAGLAAERGIELRVVEAGPGVDVGAIVAEVSGGRGADDIIMVAAFPGLIAEADAWLADGGMLVMFAGLPRGTEVPVRLGRVPRGGVQYTGTSGSTIADHQRVVELAAAGRLDPVRSLAAVAGLDAVPESLAALLDGTYAGKVVVLPQVPDLALHSIEELAAARPDVAAALGPDGGWTRAAEDVVAGGGRDGA